ncbi:hypothetical protein AAY473_038596 [Plecturocebus cupreus]
MMAHACIPSTLKGRSEHFTRSGDGGTILANTIVQLNSSRNNRGRLHLQKNRKNNPRFQRTRQVKNFRSGVQNQPSQYGETSSLLKIPKLARCGGGHLWSQLLRRQRQENHWSPGSGDCKTRQDIVEHSGDGEPTELTFRLQPAAPVVGRLTRGLPDATLLTFGAEHRKPGTGEKKPKHMMGQKPVTSNWFNRV